jgi:hypothetical protein
MKRYKKILLTALAIMVAITLTPFIAQTAQPAYAATEGPYTVDVHYSDNIQMKYVVRYGIDDWWTGAGDIPLGGAVDGNTKITDQLYCVDATVHFHSAPGTTTSSPGGVTTDTAPGYAISTPFTLSDNVRENLGELYWLTVNGYHGANSDNTADIRAKYSSLETKYGTPIDSTIAVMATKAAIWHFTDPTFALLSTSLTKDPSNPTPTEKARYELMVALMKQMITDAETGAATALASAAQLDVNVLATGGAKATLGSDGYYYYGPMEVIEQVNNSPGGSNTLDSIFLSASGTDTDGVSFVAATNATPSANSPLPSGQMYGTGETYQYASHAQMFYLKIPASRATNLGISNPDDIASGIVIHALGKASGVKYDDNTPMILTYQSDGVQDWEHVQAFIGLGLGVDADIYGEGLIVLQGTGFLNGDIEITKQVTGSGATEKDKNTPFEFKLELFNNITNTPVTLTPGANITGTSHLSSVSNDGTFYLAAGETVKVSHLPVGTYTVTEVGGSGFKQNFSVNGGNTTDGSSVNTTLGMQIGESKITATNTKESTVVQENGSIKVIKVVNINGKTVTPSDDENFTVKLTSRTSGGNIFTFELNKANGWEQTLNNIPNGTYDVTETGGNDGYTVSYSPQAVEVNGNSDETVPVTVTNSKTTGDNGGGNGSVKIIKVVKVNGKTVTPSDNENFTVKLTPRASGGNSFIFILNKANGWNQTLDNIPNGTYDVTETGGNSGYTVSYSPKTIEVDGNSGTVVAVTVTNSRTTGGNGGGGNGGDSNGSGSNGSGSNNGNNYNAQTGDEMTSTTQIMVSALAVLVILAAFAIRLRRQR